ncbi:MAG: hypothetical protein U9R74_00230 [Pseudomonadota bacterium]|nr:hypothetical protein [Pseudomonadota bacterium]
MPDSDRVEKQLATWRLPTILFVLSFATVLFTVALFRLLTFFIMPSLFFDLLFIGFPLGALAGASFFQVNKQSFIRSLGIVQGAMVFSVVAMLACKHFDYLRAHLFDVELWRLFGQMLTFTLFFIPFFVAYGLSEYIGYQVGRRHLRGRMPVVYAIYLFGAAAAYLFAQTLLPSLGAARLLMIPFGLVGIAMILLSPSLPVRRLLLAGQLILVGLLLTPQIEGGFLKLYKGASPQSTHAYAGYGFETIFQKWGKYSLVEIMQLPDTEQYVGFYNDIIQWMYSPEKGFIQPGMGMIPIDRSPPGASIAIIGSGGGRQVQYARKSGRDVEEILAIEVEPAILDAVQEPLAERFDHVYAGDNVELVNHEARSYMEKTDRLFDLIYLPSVGGYPQMMLEPGNMIRTLEAFGTLRDRLGERGVLAIWYPSVLDPKGILTEQYVRTAGAPEIGLQVRAFRSPGDVLILAARETETLPTITDVRDFYYRSEARTKPFPFNIFDAPVEVKTVWDSATFRPISDDQPFLAGNVQHIFSIRMVGYLFVLVAGLLVIFSVLLLLPIRRRGDPGIPGRSFSQVVLVSLFVGANFLVLEHFLILMLFNKLYVYHDAVVLGAISFLVITGLGSTFITPRWRPPLQFLGGVLIVILLLTHAALPPWAGLALLAPVAFVTGSFFPALFEAAAENPLGVFAADAIGAAVGSMASFFIPIVLGFSWFFAFAAVMFWMTAAATYLFFRNPAVTPRVFEPAEERGGV